MRTLIVEDEPRIATYLARGLVENGYAVDLANDGEEGLSLALANPYELIVLDILLPKLNGIEMCKLARANGVRSLVLMLTARDSVDDRVAGLDAGADDYLTKPFALRELIARMRALTRRIENGSRQNVLEVHDLKLDLLSHRVFRCGKKVDLTSKEFAILECLMRFPDRVFTRDMITESVWSYDRFHESNIVDVYIRNLRRKIDDGHDIKLIHTIRGAGYRIAVDD